MMPVRLRADLLIREYKENRVLHLLVVQHPVQLLSRLSYAVSIVAVHHKNQRLRVHVVVAPEQSDLVLAANVPDRIAEAREELRRMLHDEELKDAALLVFANKQVPSQLRSHHWT